MQGLTLNVPQGAVYALLGPNGAGKTTVIKILMNIIPSSSGRAEVLGVDSARIRGRLFESGGFGPAEMGISPVHQVLIDPSEWDWSGGLPFTPGLCPGTPLTLSNPEVTGSRGLEVEFDNISSTTSVNVSQNDRALAPPHFLRGRYLFSIEATTT